MICGWTRNKNAHIESTNVKVFDENSIEKPLKVNEMPSDEVIQVQSNGFGCVLFKLSFLTKLKMEKYFEAKVLKHGNWWGEDYMFCKRMNALNIPIYCHTGVMCGHIWKSVYYPKNSLELKDRFTY
jgi:hypothetical protein